MAAKKTKKRARPRGVEIEPLGLGPNDLCLTELSPELKALRETVAADGGTVLASYREPLGGHALFLVALPMDKIRPTPFQRDVSEPHVKKLVHAMDKTKRFLDPIILVHQADVYYTPNGHHRLTALRQLGSQAAIGLLVPEFAVAYQILALNIEKAHTLRERALEVVRMHHDLAGSDSGHETAFEFEFEEPALLTLGFAYETRPRIAGGAYHSVLRKVDTWIDAPLARAAEERKVRSDLVLDLDDAVTEAVGKLKERGLTSPYLRNFVVARVNPLRFVKGELPSLTDLFTGMIAKTRKLKLDSINPSDLARTGGAPDEE
jgi:ParB family transcriptional regulator, chromosome partitioning protein